MRPHLPRRERLHQPRRNPETPPSPVRSRPHRPRRPQLRPHHRHRLRQEPHLHHPHRGPCPETWPRKGDPGDSRLSHECPRQQSVRRAHEVPERRIPRRQGPGHLRPLHRPGVRRGAPAHHRGPPGHPAHQLRDAGAYPHPLPGAPARPTGSGPWLPRLRRAAHLPRSPGGGRCVPDPAYQGVARREQPALPALDLDRKYLRRDH